MPPKSKIDVGHLQMEAVWYVHIVKEQNNAEANRGDVPR